MIIKLMFGGLVIGAVLIGAVAQVGDFLLGFTPPGDEVAVSADNGHYAGRGEHGVGIRRFEAEETPVPAILWYPAVAREDGPASYTYAYSINMLGAGISTALATFEGTAATGAPEDVSSGPYPLVVLSHGFAISASSYGWLAEHLASHGFVVAAPAHDESLDPGALWKSTVDRPMDIAAVVELIEEETAPGGDLHGLVDGDLVAVVGHSYGGYTAQVAGGARLDTAAIRSTCETAYDEVDPIVFLCDALLPRLGDMARAAGLAGVPDSIWPDWSLPAVDAVVSVAGDAAMFGPAGLAEVDVPVLAIGGTADTDSPFEWGTRYTYDHVSDRKVEVALEGAGHMVFAGECGRSRRILALVSLGFCTDPSWDGDRARGIVSHYATAFLLSELKGDREAAAALAPDLQSVSQVGYQAEGY